MSSRWISISLGDQASPAMISRKLTETRILTVASPAYLKRYGRPKQPSDLKHHAGILFRDPASGRAFDWEFHKGRKVVKVDVRGRITLSDGNALITECAAGTGIAQVTENSVRELLDSGKLVDLFPDWNGEVFPLYAIYPSRQHLPAKVRAFIDFVMEIG